MIQPGTLLQNRYRVSRQIGHGGMGTVYVATDERFRSTVAIKQTFFDDPALRKAFEREAHLLNHLRHAALPKVSDHFIEDDGQYLVMEYIEGLDFSELLEQRNGPFPLADVLRWADELLDALDYLHTQEPPVIHRDIKPQNLKLTTRGRVVLLDFGLAKGMPLQTRTGANASVFGYSLNYAPLEQMQGAGTDARSDIYSLGATLYHLLTGLLPADALTRAAAAINHQPDPLRPAHRVHAQVPAAVGKLLHRAMAQNSALRPATAAELRAALREAASARPLASHQSPAAHAISPAQSAFHEATLLEPPAPAHGETTIVDAAHRAPRRQAETFTHLAPRAPSNSSPRNSPKLFIAAAVVLLIACASVPFMLARRSDSTPDNFGTQIETAPGASASATETAAPAAMQPAVGETPNSLSAAPAQTQDTAGESSTINAQPAPGDTGANGVNGARAGGSDLGADGGNGSTASHTGTGGRPALVIQEPAPSPTPVDHSAAAEEAARRAEEAARRAEEARNSQQRENEARATEGRRPPPPDRRFPSPPNGRRPLPHRPLPLP